MVLKLLFLQLFTHADFAYAVVPEGSPSGPCHLHPAISDIVDNISMRLSAGLLSSFSDSNEIDPHSIYIHPVHDHEAILNEDAYEFTMDFSLEFNLSNPMNHFHLVAEDENGQCSDRHFELPLLVKMQKVHIAKASLSDRPEEACKITVQSRQNGCFIGSNGRAIPVSAYLSPLYYLDTAGRFEILQMASKTFWKGSIYENLNLIPSFSSTYLFTRSELEQLRRIN